MAKPVLNVGLVGCGFMGRTHSNAFRQVAQFFDVPFGLNLRTVCSRDAVRTRAFAARWGFARVESAWRRLVEDPAIDLVDIAAPNDVHWEIAIAAAAAGKMVACEKPLATTAARSAEMVEAVEAAGVPNMVWYNYRRTPAATLAQRLIADGRLGRVFHYRAKFLQDWTMSADLQQGGAGLWRLEAAKAGSGVTGDLLSHCVDMALWLNGPIREVAAMTDTFIKERRHALTGEVAPVSIDDACAVLARFDNGSSGTFEATRFARGHKALMTFEVNGQDASLAWDLHDLHRLGWFDHRDDKEVRGWRSIHVSEAEHPYMDRWWVPGLQIGYEHTFIHQIADFLVGLETGRPTVPTFRDAWRTDRVLDAVLGSARDRLWVTVSPE